MRLLIIEDEWLVAHFIADVAITHGMEVIGIAQSYNEAVQLIHTESIDCAIVDINIRGAKNGIDAAHDLKRKNIPFFFLTAYKDIETIKEATNLNPLSYLIKPVSEENLIAAFLILKNTLNIPGPKYHPFSINNEGMILKHDEILPLSQAERTVFALLIKNHRNIVPHETFFEHLWNHPDDINDGTLRNIILKLRKKFDLHIDNIKNTGYVLISY